jgi:hypothetical protein
MFKYFPTVFKSFLGILIFASTLLGLVACGNDGNAEAEKINDEIMKSHDEAMHKMSEIERLKQNLKKYNDLTSDENVAQKDSIINTILILGKANDGMMDWMSNFKFPQNDLNKEQAIQYLKKQQDSVKMVSNDIFMSIAIANALLKNAPDSLRK